MPERAVVTEEMASLADVAVAAAAAAAAVAEASRSESEKPPEPEFEFEVEVPLGPCLLAISRSRSLINDVREDVLMERSVTFTAKTYRLWLVTPARPATSIAIKLPTVRRNGSATQRTRPTPIFADFVWYLGGCDVDVLVRRADGRWVARVVVELLERCQRMQTSYTPYQPKRSTMLKKTGVNG